MSWEQLARRYKDLGESARYHQDRAAEAQREQAQIVLNLYDRWHLTSAEIARALGGITADQVQEMILAVTT